MSNGMLGGFYCSNGQNLRRKYQVWYENRSLGDRFDIFFLVRDQFDIWNIVHGQK